MSFKNKSYSFILFYFSLAFLFMFTFSLGFKAMAAEKGIRLGAFIKDPSGVVVNQTLSQIDVQILAPNGCVLMGERFSGVVVSNGYLYLNLFKGARVTAASPAPNLYDKGYSSI